MPIFQTIRRATYLFAATSVLAFITTACGQQPQATTSVSGAAAGTGGTPLAAELGQLTGHPLEPALDIAYKGFNRVNKEIKDYTCTMRKIERVDGKLVGPEVMFVKVRHQPFSVYLNFINPENEGREVIYVAGQNNGELVAHEAKGIKSLVGPVSLKPNSALAMAGNRYPITELGMLNLCKRLIEVGEQDRKFGECDVKFVPNAKVNGRGATCIQVTHPVPRKNFRYHLARIYVDDELQMPIRFESYDWPREEGGKMLLLEEYTYYNIKTNVGLTDADFDTKNPNYKFTKR
jgi:Protein of unknown function (DUF1571)